MKHVTPYVGIDAHKKDLFIAMLIGHEATPVTWTVPNEPNAVRRFVRRLERDAPRPGFVARPHGSCSVALEPTHESSPLVRLIRHRPSHPPSPLTKPHPAE